MNIVKHKLTRGQRDEALEILRRYRGKPAVMREEIGEWLVEHSD